MGQTPHPAARQALAEAVANLTGRLDSRRAAAAAAWSLDGMGKAADRGGREALTGALGVLAHRATAQGLVDLLKHPLCVGQARDRVLSELRRQVNCPLEEYWEVIAWLAEHGPVPDLDTPPRRPDP
jgi:hypothetical protein